MQGVVAIAQVPGPSVGPPANPGAGGRMPIQTGFLRASIQGAEGQMPAGETTNKSGKEYPAGKTVSGEPISVALLQWDPNKGTPFFVGWTAAYARYMEYRYGFLRGATEQWDTIVEKVVMRVKRDIP